MKYTIVINQKALASAGLVNKLNIADMAIFDVVKSFMECNSSKKKVMLVDNTQYVEIKASLLLQELPLFGTMSRQTFHKRMSKLCSCELLKRYDKNQLEGRSFYTKGRLWDITAFDWDNGSNDNGGEKELSTCKLTVTRPVNESLYVGVKQSLHNDSINKDNDIIKDDITIKENKKKSPPLTREAKEKKEIATEVASPSQIPNFNFIVETWNNTCTRLPKIISLSDSRKRKIRIRWKEFSELGNPEIVFVKIVTKLNASNFCGGTNGHAWVASFDFLFDSPNNWRKILEGNYDNRETKAIEKPSLMQQNAENAKAARGMLGISEEMHRQFSNGQLNQIEIPQEQECDCSEECYEEFHSEDNEHRARGIKKISDLINGLQ